MTSKTGAGRVARTRTAIATCPDCGEKINLTGVIRIGQRVRCPNCEADLEVIDTYPVELDWVSENLVGRDVR